MSKTLGHFAECVITSLSLEKGEPLGSTLIYQLEKKVFFSWQFDQKRVREIGWDATEEFQKLGEGTLLVWEKELPTPIEYPSAPVKKVRIGLLGKSGFEFDMNYSSLYSVPFIHHVVLPNYCYYSPDPNVEKEDRPVPAFHATRQSLTFVSHTGHLRTMFTFNGPDPKNFDDLSKKEVRRMTIPHEAKIVYGEVKEWASGVAAKMAAEQLSRYTA